MSIYDSTEWVPHPKLADYTDLIFNPTLDAGIELSRQIDCLLHRIDELQSLAAQAPSPAQDTPLPE